MTTKQIAIETNYIGSYVFAKNVPENVFVHELAKKQIYAAELEKGFVRRGVFLQKHLSNFDKVFVFDAKEGFTADNIYYFVIDASEGKNIYINAQAIESYGSSLHSNHQAPNA
jgi:hypothetical protein